MTDYDEIDALVDWQLEKSKGCVCSTSDHAEPGCPERAAMGFTSLQPWFDLQAAVLAADCICPGCCKRYAVGDVVSSENGATPSHTDCSDPKLKQDADAGGSVGVEQTP